MYLKQVTYYMKHIKRKLFKKLSILYAITQFKGREFLLYFHEPFHSYKADLCMWVGCVLSNGTTGCQLN